MSYPSEKQLNRHLRRAVSSIPSDHAEALWDTPVEKADSSAWFLEGTETKRRITHRYLRWASLAAACFAIILFGWFRVSGVPDANVYLDVNPSVTLDVNRLGKVIRAEAENEDGRIILDNMNLHHTDVDVAMNALLGSMVRHGYLSRTQNTLLLSVNGKSKARTAALRQKLSLSAQQTLETLLGSGIILGQTVDVDDAAEDVAEHYGITPGKAALMLRLLKDQPSWDLQDLTAMPMSDLIRYCQAAGIDIAQYLGEDSEVIGDLDSLMDEDHDDHDDRDDPDDHEDADDEDRDDPEDHEDPEKQDERDDADDPDDENDPDDDEEAEDDEAEDDEVDDDEAADDEAEDDEAEDDD